SNRRALTTLPVVFLFLFAPSAHTADSDLARRASQLAQQQQWKQVVNLIEPIQTRSPDLQFYYGIALAQLGRLHDARNALLSGARPEPVHRINPALLDLAFAFSPASVMKAAELQTTDVRVRDLGVFSSYRFELLPRQDEKYDIVFHNKERNGLGQNKKEALFRIFRGLPF